MKRVGIAVFLLSLLLAIVFIGQKFIFLYDDMPVPPDYSPGVALTSQEQIDLVQAHPPQATIALEPSTGKAQVYRRIHCRVRLTVPEDVPAPDWVFVTLRRKGLDYDHAPLEIQKHEGESYILEKTIRAPNKPGKYRLVVIAEYTINPKSPVGKDQGIRPIQHEILGPEIQVHK